MIPTKSGTTPSTTLGPTRRFTSRGLFVLNGALLAVLVALIVFAPAPAEASGDASGAQPVSVRARGEYTMVSGKTNQGTINAVYVIDAANREMVALMWEPNRKSFAGIGYRNLDADAKAQPGR